MRQARNLSALADRGARFAGCLPTSSPAGRAAAPASPPPDAGAATICTVPLSDRVNLALDLATSALAIDRGEFVRRAIVDYAYTYAGLPCLSAEDARRERCDAAFTPQGDLTEPPEPKRFGPNRFRSQAPP